MRTLADVVNAPKKAEISLEDCVIVKQQEDGTFNIVCTINNSKVYVNYVNANKCSNNKLYVQFGKKEEKWKRERWYQVDAPKPEEEEEEEETKEEK